jgi:hypothetical protein
MAEKNIVGGMFGSSPEMYAMQRDIAGQQQAATLAAQPGTLMSPSLAPFYAQAAQQGQLLGKVTGSLLGVEDPELAKIRDVQQMRTQFDVSTPTGLRSFAQALGQKGYTDLAIQAASEADKRDVAAATVTAKTREQLPTIAKLQSYRENLAAQLGPNDPRVREVDAIIRAEGEGKGTKIVMPAGETEAAKTIGKGVGEKVLATASAGEAGADNLIKINETLNELKTNKAFTGSFSELQTNIAKVQAKFAADKEAGKRVTDTEYLDALLGSDVFPMISSLGIGAKGLDTPAEREFLRKVMTGTVALERDTLIKLTETRKNIAERAVKKYNEKVDAGELNEYFKIKGISPRKIEIPKSDDSAALGADYEAYAKYWTDKGRTPKTREQYIQEKRNLQGGRP